MKFMHIKEKTVLWKSKAGLEKILLVTATVQHQTSEATGRNQIISQVTWFNYSFEYLLFHFISVSS